MVCCLTGSENSWAKDKMEFQYRGDLMNLPGVAVSKISFCIQCWATGNPLILVALCRGWPTEQAPLPDCLLLIAGNNPPGISTPGQRQ